MEQNKDREISLLKKEIAFLKQNRSEIKAEHNSRGAGRKEFQDYKTVQHIFDLYTNGDSLQEIANKLNDLNIKTRIGGTWAKSSVRFILLNKAYLEKGIIDEKTFSLISERMRRKN